MNEPTAPAPNRARRPTGRIRWILVAAVAVIAVLGSVGVVMAVNGSTPQMTAKQSLTEYIARMDDVARTAGGKWWFEEKDVPDRGAWIIGTYPGYASVPCGNGKQGTNQYTYTLYGQGEAETDKAATVMIHHWEKLGYSVRTVSRNGAALDNVIEIAVTLPDGADLVYTVGNSSSGISGSGACLPRELFPQPKKRL